MMGLLSRGSLLALLWTSLALATPLTVDQISSELSVRDTTQCPTSYESKNGMNFTTYCDQNNPFNDALDPFDVGSMQECMERCSRYWGNGEGCFGVVWVSRNGQCWIRNSTTSTSGLTPQSGTHSALVESKDMQALNEDCPATDLSVHSLDNVEGIGYTVHCGKVIGGYDTCWGGYPSCLESPFIGWYHATSLEECLQYCIKEHPLCRAVSYNPGLEIGFANCWPKTGFGNTLDDPTSNMGVLHSATITSLDTIDTKCPSDSSYTSSSNGNKAFDIHCGQLNAGTNITSVHTQNITSCMDQCAGRDKCIGIVFDSTLQNGYNNCYLQNTTSVISTQASATYASLSGTSLPSSSSSGSPGGNNDDSSSKAWIAGPVVGGVAGLALIGAAIWWIKRRKSTGAAGGSGTYEKDANPYAGSAAAPAYKPVAQYAAPPSELGGDHAREMDGAGLTKYAHNSRPQAPQELPT